MEEEVFEYSSLPQGSPKTTEPATELEFQRQHDNSYRYGWGKFKPDVIQDFNKPVYFLICASIVICAQGFVITGLNNAFFTTWERRYGFRSTQVALFNTFYHTGGAILIAPIAYFGHKHRPRTIALSNLILIVGLVIAILPQLVSDRYIAGVRQSFDTCQVQSKRHPCNVKENEGASNSHILLIFIIGYIFMGIGSPPLYNLSIAHLDTITARGQNAIYISIFTLFSILGPCLGYMAGKPFLKIYVDLKQPEGSELTPSSSSWVGAWWLGYIVGATILSIPVFPMFGFSAAFPDTKLLKQKKLELQETIEDDQTLNHDVKSIWPATKALLKNVPFMCICLASASESLAIGGFATFVPKFVETQFHFSASDSSLAAGVIVIVGAAGGTVAGGLLLKKLRWSCSTTLKASAAMAFIATVFVAFVFVGCDGRQVVGATTPYYNQTSHTGLVGRCNNECQCSTKFYKPICTEADMKTYFSPCHAGCPQNHTYTGSFFNCSCFPPGITEAKNGRCDPKCTVFPLYVVGAFLLMFFTFLNNVPMLNALLRVVPENQGSFAMGFQQIFVRCLGFIPAPTLFGTFIDKSCSFWHRDDCTNQTNSCLEYKNYDFRAYIFMLGTITKFLSFAFVFLAYRFYRLPSNKSSNMCDSFQVEATNDSANGGKHITYSMNELEERA